jgi:hypothetical protein
MSIYKYTPTHIPGVDIFKYIFEDKKLFFSNLLKLNDPFELKPHIKKYEVPENDMILNMGANLINLSGQAHKSHYATANHQLKDVGILSLTNREDNLMLWAHYADSHKGIVIEFDEKHPFFTDSNYLHPYLLYPLDKVFYKPSRPSINSDKYYDKETFYTKSEDWKYEEEYRITIDEREYKLNPIKSEIITK